MTSIASSGSLSILVEIFISLKRGKLEKWMNRAKDEVNREALYTTKLRDS